MPARIVWRTELGQQLPGERKARRRAGEAAERGDLDSMNAHNGQTLRQLCAGQPPLEQLAPRGARHHEIHHHVRRQLPLSPPRALPGRRDRVIDHSRGTDEASTPSEIQSVSAPPPATTPVCVMTRDHAPTCHPVAPEPGNKIS